MYYTVRDMVQAITEDKLEWEWFQKIVTKYEQERGEIPGMYCDPRGYLIEPHTGKQIPLGTREVDAYDMPELLYDKILYVEKKGMHPIFREARLAERYDLAIVFAEGYASRAAKTLLSTASEQNMTLLSSHDADPYGYNIARTLREATETCPNHHVDVIDIGLQLDEALDMGLQTEFFYRKNASRRQSHSAKPNGSISPARRFPRQRQANLEGREDRVNVLAKDPDRFIAWIEGKLQGLGLAKKLLPGAKSSGRRPACSATSNCVKSLLSTSVNFSTSTNWQPPWFVSLTGKCPFRTSPAR